LRLAYLIETHKVYACIIHKCLYYKCALLLVYSPDNAPCFVKPLLFYTYTHIYTHPSTQTQTHTDTHRRTQIQAHRHTYTYIHTTTHTHHLLTQKHAQVHLLDDEAHASLASLSSMPNLLSLALLRVVHANITVDGPEAGECWPVCAVVCCVTAVCHCCVTCMPTSLWTGLKLVSVSLFVQLCVVSLLRVTAA
jgi:hypothetical protein